MKYFLILLILISYQTQAQQENALFLTLDEVDYPPAFPGCEGEDFKSCSSQKVATFLMKNLDPELLLNLEEAENYVSIRFIVDTAGRVRRPMANTQDEELRTAANELLSTLPDFIPGTHKGQPVNTIIDVPVKFSRGSLSQAEKDFLTSGYEAVSSAASEKTSPIATACKDNVEPERCTTFWVQEFVQKRFNLDRMRGKKGVLKVLVKFVVDEEGKVKNITVEGEDDKMKKEAIKVVEKLPDFIPATEEGKSIPYNYTLPIVISINKSR